MAASYANFIVRFPEFATVTEPRIQLFLDDAALLMGAAESRWLTYYEVAQEYLAAHFLIAAQRTESGDSNVLAPISKKEVEDVVIHRAVGEIAATAEDVYSTSYGKRYAQYRRICFSGMWGV